MLRTGSSSRSRRRTVATPTSAPTAIAPSTAQPNSSRVSTREKLPAAASAATAVRRMTRADASLTRLSPSSTVISRGGRPTRRPIAVAATASVGATTAPSATASANGMLGKSQCTAAPITTAETTTRPAESHVISARLRRSSITGRLTADE